MGNSNWDPASYGSYSRSVSTKTREEIFTSRKLPEELDPAKFVIRESFDSPANPESTPIILSVDDTGSMGHLAELIIKTGLGTIMENIIAKKPVTDPHVCMSIFGDAYCDSAPFQATQFEADIALVKQIEKFYIESGGGGNNGESYMLPWFFAVNKTNCDAIRKHGRKGYIFTAGDENCLPLVTGDQIKRIFGITCEFKELKSSDLLAICQRDWEVFHLITPTDATRQQDAINNWKKLLCERAIVVEDWKRLPEIIVSLMQVNEGQDKDDVVSAWDGDCQAVVKSAINNLPSKSKTPQAIVETI